VAGFAGDIGAVLTRQDILTNVQCRAVKTGQDRTHEGRSMSTVKNALAQKSGALIHVRSGDMVVEALRQMRENRVRSVLVIDDDVLVGIVTQGDCAIKVLLPVVKNIIRDLEHNVDDLMGYIMKDGPGG
jgi:CBS domain-containing protein